jgi:hypothetical protein
MASDDANGQSAMAKQDHVMRHCERCSAVMKQLGEFPSLSIRAAIRVFRCYACDHVATDRI